MDQRRVAGQLSTKTLPVTLQPALDRLFAQEAWGHALRQPLGRLKCPPAPDSPKRIGGQGGVTHERKAGGDRSPPQVGHLDLAQDRGDHSRLRDRRRVG